MPQKRNLLSCLGEELLSRARLLVAKRRLAAWQEIADLVKTPRAHIGGRLPSRDELHER